MRRAAPSQFGRVSVGFAGDSTQTMSASGGGAVLVELDEADARTARAARSAPVPKYAPSASAIVAPARANASSTIVVAPIPDA